MMSAHVGMALRVVGRRKVLEMRTLEEGSSVTNLWIWRYYTLKSGLG
jgi:hypothetical protein